MHGFWLNDKFYTVVMRELIAYRVVDDAATNTYQFQWVQDTPLGMNGYTITEQTVSFNTREELVNFKKSLNATFQRYEKLLQARMSGEAGRLFGGPPSGSGSSFGASFGASLHSDVEPPGQDMFASQNPGDMFDATMKETT